MGRCLLELGPGNPTACRSSWESRRHDTGKYIPCHPPRPLSQLTFLPHKFSTTPDARRHLEAPGATWLVQHSVSYTHHSTCFRPPFSPSLSWIPTAVSCCVTEFQSDKNINRDFGPIRTGVSKRKQPSDPESTEVILQPLSSPLTLYACSSGHSREVSPQRIFSIFQGLYGLVPLIPWSLEILAFCLRTFKNAKILPNCPILVPLHSTAWNRNWQPGGLDHFSDHFMTDPAQNYTEPAGSAFVKWKDPYNSHVSSCSIAIH